MTHLVEQHDPLPSPPPQGEGTVASRHVENAGGEEAEKTGSPPTDWSATTVKCGRLRNIASVLRQLAASAGHRAQEADRLPPARRYQPYRAKARSVLRHAMHRGTVGLLANRPRPHPPVETGSRPPSCNHRSASRSRYSVRRRNSPRT